MRADADALRPLIADLLAVSHDAGSRVPPSPANVEALLSKALAGGEGGDPCLVAVDDGRAVGLVVWTGGAPLGDYDGVVCFGWGTYVAPAARRTGVARELRDRAAALAKERGYTTVLGAAYSQEGFAACLATGFHVVGVLVERAL